MWPLALMPSGEALCLHCYTPLPSPPAGCDLSSAEPTAHLSSDTELFCGGGCRAAYMARRSTGSLRRQLAILDGTVCASCGLDAGALCTLLSEAPPGGPRERLLRRLAPSIADLPKLAARLLSAPHLGGHCWHADHKLAVADGGGECSLDNMQVLCVACHAAKTSRERQARAASSSPGRGRLGSPSPSNSPRQRKARKRPAAEGQLTGSGGNAAGTPSPVGSPSKYFAAAAGREVAASSPRR